MDKKKAEQYHIQEVEKELMADRAKEKILLDSIPGGVALYHIMNDGTIRASYISEGLAGIMGYTAKEFLELYGNDTKECVLQEDRAVVGGAIKNMLETHTPISNHYRLYTKNDDVITISFDGNVVDFGKKLPGEIATLYAVQSLVSDKHQKEIQEDKIRQRLINYVPCGIGIYALYKGMATLQYLNDAYLSMMELGKEDREQYYGHDISGVIYPEDRNVLTDMIQEIYQGKRLCNVLFRIRSGSGKWKWVNLVMTVVQEDDEHYTGYASLFDFDKVILNQQEMEAARKKEETLLSSIPGGIAIYHAKKNGKVATEYVSEPLAKMCGYTAEEFLDYLREDSLVNLVPDDIPMVNAAVMKGLENHQPVSIVYRIYKKDKTQILIRLDANVIETEPLAEDEIAVFYGVHTLVSDESKRIMEEQKTLSILLNSVPAGIGIYTMENGVLNQEYMNDAFFELLGDTREGREQYNGKNAMNSIHPDDLPAVNKSIGSLTQGASTTQVDYRLINSSGTYTWFHVTASVTERREGYIRFFTAFFDCSESKEQEQMLLQNEQKLREQMNNNVMLYIEYNLTKDCYENAEGFPGSYHKSNWEGVSNTGYLAGLSQAIEDVYAEEVAEKMYSQNLLKAFASGETRVYVECRSKERPDMPSTWYRISASMVKRPDTGDIMAFIYVENIEKEKEKRLAMESSLSDGIESIAVIHVADGRTRLIRDDYSPAEKVMYDEYFTYDDDFVWCSHRAVVEEDSEFSYQSGLLANIVKELENQEVFQYSIGTHSKTGVFKRQLFRFRYLDDRKASIVMSVSNITSVYMEEQAKKKQLEQALLETKKASAAKTEFYSRMSHDMRTPMNGILGMTALSKNEQDVAVLHENLTKIHESGEYLLNLINDTLDIQRIESGRLKLETQIVHTESIVSSIMEMMRPAAEAKGVSLEFDQGNADISWYVRIDPVRIKQIFVNLLSNAIKFTPSGGTVKLSSKLLSREGMISHDVFTISDTGLGMSEEFLENGIFQPFSQENNKVTANYAGSGLGLSIVKSLVELMGGKISVESELGAGTTFTIYLDMVRVSKEDVNRESEQEHTQSKDFTSLLNGKRILLVEDHPLNAEIAKKLLDKVGCIVTWVDDGQKAVETIENSQVHDFNAVLMDIRMPVMDGLEATRQIRALKKPMIDKLPIIAMTANAYENDIKESLNAGMNAHLGKPIEPQMLYETLAVTGEDYEWI